MNPFDERPNPPPPEESGPAPEESPEDLFSRIVVHPAEPGPPPPASTEVPPPPPASFLPADLRISWSWVHLIFFGMFALGSLVVIQLGFVLYYAAGRRMNPRELEQLLQSKPEVAVGSNVLWFFLVFLFLYVTLALLRGRPFWPTLGWRKLDPISRAPSNPWIYFAGGIALAVCVAVASSRIKTPDHLPIQELFRNRTGAFLLLSMAVFVAPLVEETVFRGYLYPLFASTSSKIAKGFGADSASAVSLGSAIGIVVTGVLFGFLHGAQLGWTWTLVAMLSTVGIVFTFARARAGSVLASFLLHLGYNSFIAFSAIVSTRGFTQMPPHP
jgi:membrane protease YdiL (CAAX protease family)